MPITPDTKNWTWVLERACPDCGFDPAQFETSRVGAMIRDDAREWQRVLRQRAVRERPDESTWSALEYACHVRDVYGLFDERLELMLTDDDARFENWDQDATAVEDHYDEQDPATVATVLAGNAARLADRFDTVTDDQWDRTGRRSDGSVFSVSSFACYLMHDPIHHQWDVAKGFDELTH